MLSIFNKLFQDMIKFPEEKIGSTLLNCFNFPLNKHLDESHDEILFASVMLFESQLRF